MVMADNFNFELVSPERLLVSGSVSEVVIPATEGEMTVMANHAPTMTTIKPGVVTVKAADGKKDRYVVFGGFADIIPTGCTLLAESAVHVDEFNSDDITRRIDVARTAKGRDRAAHRLATAPRDRRFPYMQALLRGDMLGVVCDAEGMFCRGQLDIQRSEDQDIGRERCDAGSLLLYENVNDAPADGGHRQHRFLQR